MPSVESWDRTFNLLFSFWSSRHNFSSFSFSETVLLSSCLLLSLSFWSWSVRFLFLMLSRSWRFISMKRSEQRFVKNSIFCMSIILAVWFWSSLFAFRTSRSAHMLAPERLIGHTEPRQTAHSRFSRLEDCRVLRSHVVIGQQKTVREGFTHQVQPLDPCLGPHPSPAGWFAAQSA